MVFAFGSFVGGKVNSLLGEGEANKDENNGLPNVNFVGVLDPCVSQFS
jgi:hypothetical protein